MEKRIIALGFFDGVHTGHARLLEKTTERASEMNAVPAALSFDTHPGKTVSGENVPLIISSLDRADFMRRRFGIGDLIFLHFDEWFMRMPWDGFIDYLVNDFGAVHFVAGYDFRFGYKGEGNAEKLAARCAELGIGCDVIPAVEMGGSAVSSTRIRELLETGAVEEANELLGHPHFFTDNVRCGYRLGRRLGMPTVNMRFEDGVLIPKYGVYATKTHILETGEIFPSVTNIGVRPTVGGTDAVSVETYIIGYSGNLYGQRLLVEFYKFIRPEVKFSSTDELSAQAHRDADSVREYFA